MSPMSRRLVNRPLATSLLAGAGLLLALVNPASADHGLLTLRVTIMACEDAGSIVLDDGLTSDECPPVLLPADDPGEPPAGYTWLHQPILADTQLEIEVGLETYTRQDMVFVGEVVCLESPKHCWVPASYDVAVEVAAGPLTVRQVTFPGGFGPGTAYLRGGDVPVPLTIETDGTVAFDGTGAHFRHVIFANDALAPAPASARPTTPPTSTIDGGPHRDGGRTSVASVLAATAVLGALVWCVTLSLRRRPVR